MIGLEALSRQVRRDLELIELPGETWVPATVVDGAEIPDVVIIGGGLNGLTAALALRLRGILRLRILDQSRAGQEGPWVTYARMATLRTRKEFAGPAMGIASLTFRAWFEAQFGAEAFAALERPTRLQWMDYLNWFREVLGLRVENEVRVQEVQPIAGGLVRVTTTQGEILTRRVVLATGAGPANLPAVGRGFDRAYVSHASDLIDFSRFKGKVVGVVGAGASAMDNALAAAKAGAARVHVLVRRPAIPAVDRYKGIASLGASESFIRLPDEYRWHVMRAFFEGQTPPPKHSVLAIAAFDTAHLHFGAALQSLALEGGRLSLKTASGSFRLDHLVFATGYSSDPADQPELRALAPSIRQWRDVLRPDQAAENLGLASFPYLAEDFAFLPKAGAEGQGVERLFCFTFAALASHGKLTTGIPSVSTGAARLATGVARSLYLQDQAHHRDRFDAYAEPDLDGTEWPADRIHRSGDWND